MDVSGNHGDKTPANISVSKLKGLHNNSLLEIIFRNHLELFCPPYPTHPGHTAHRCVTAWRMEDMFTQDERGNFNVGAIKQDLQVCRGESCLVWCYMLIMF